MDHNIYFMPYIQISEDKTELQLDPGVEFGLFSSWLAQQFSKNLQNIIQQKVDHNWYFNSKFVLFGKIMDGVSNTLTILVWG